MPAESAQIRRPRAARQEEPTRGRLLGQSSRQAAGTKKKHTPTARKGADGPAAAMDRVQLLLLGIPFFLFCSDLVGLFTPPSRPPRPHHHHDHRPSHPPLIPTPDISSPQTRGLGYGATVELNFCTSCSYRGNALTTKKMLETSFPGITVVLSNYPPPLPKRLLSKLVPVVQAGVFGIVMAGDQILPRLGYVALPPWYHSLRANRFGTIASTWLLGNMVQNFLQSSGAFEVYCNGDLVFSKLKEHRFPSEIELRNLISERIGSPRFGVEGTIWS